MERFHSHIIYVGLFKYLLCCNYQCLKLFFRLQFILWHFFLSFFYHCVFIVLKSSFILSRLLKRLAEKSYLVLQALLYFLFIWILLRLPFKSNDCKLHSFTFLVILFGWTFSNLNATVKLLNGR